MRLLFVLTEFPYPPHRNGIALINYEIIRRAPDGVQLDLLVANSVDREAEAELRKLAPNLGSVTHVRGVEARIGHVANLLGGACTGRYIYESPSAVRFLRSYGADYDAIYLAPLITYVDPGRLPNTFMNAVDSFARFNAVKYWRTGRRIDCVRSCLYSWYERKVLRRVALASFVSSADLSYVKARSHGLRLICIPNGIDTDYFHPEDRDRERHSVLFTGNFAYAPNLEAVVYFARQVMPMLRARQPQTTFYVVGRNPPDCLKGIPGVVVTGFVDDIRPYYWRCSVFVCPLLSGAGVKNKVLEAMASGIPVVTTSRGVDGIDGIMAGKHYVSAEQPADFADRILWLWETSSQVACLTREARRAVSDLMTWSGIAERYYEALAQVARSGT